MDFCQIRFCGARQSRRGSSAASFDIAKRCRFTGCAQFGRAVNRSIRAEHAAIFRSGPQQRIARRAIVEGYSTVLGNPLVSAMAALGQVSTDSSWMASFLVPWLALETPPLAKLLLQDAAGARLPNRKTVPKSGSSCVPRHRALPIPALLVQKLLRLHRASW